MYEGVFAIQGDFENPGATDGYIVYVKPGEGSFDALGQQVDLVQVTSGWQVTQNGGPIAEKLGSDPVGMYSFGFMVGAMCDLVLEETNASPSPRRSSLELSREEQDQLGVIAFHVGAIHRGQGSYRVLLRKILKGEIRCEKVNKNLIFGNQKGL